MSIGRHLDARLFLEGMSVPFNQVTIQNSEGQPSVAHINLAPLPEIKRFKPRTMVHIFTRDYTSRDDKKPWILAFEGEIYGFGYDKTSSSRSSTIMAMDVSNYWDNAKQYYMNLRTSYGDNLDVLIGTKEISENKKENNEIITTTTGAVSYLTSIITQALNSGKDLLEAVSDILKKNEEVNPFFRFNQQRYRINDKVVFKSSNLIKQLFDFTNREKMWDSISGAGSGGLTTLRDIVSMIINLVFHDFNSVVYPSKVTKKIDDPLTNGKTIGSFILKPQTFMMPPPKCNVIYPDQYGSMSYNRNFFHEVTRLKSNRTPLGMEQRNQKAQGILEYVYSPNAYQKFRKTKDTTKGSTQFSAPESQGEFGDKATDLKNTTTLQDFNFLSYEEIMKGIFSEQGTALPSSHIFSLMTSPDQRGDFFQKANDYLFFQKRLASRSFNTNGPLNFAPVMGFPILFLDDSSAEQNTIGVLSSITHVISSDGGGYTSYGVSYARDVDELDLWDESISEPPIPPWFDPSIFGKQREVGEKDYINLPKDVQEKVKRFSSVIGYEGTTIRDFYLGLLGDTKDGSHLGSDPIVSEKFPSVYSATLALVEEYKGAKKKGNHIDLIDINTRRDYVLLDELFTFLGAELTAKQKNVNITKDIDIVFSGTVLDGGYVDVAETNSADNKLKPFFKEVITKRGDPIKAYRKRLLKERGFRG